MYTRYADDLTFSTSQRHFPRSIAYIDHDSGTAICGEDLLRVFKDCGFRPNAKKTRLQSAPNRRAVTGLTVNEIPNVSRVYVREMDSILHCWRKNGSAVAHQVYCKKKGLPQLPPNHLRQVLLGKLGYIEMAKGARRLRWEIADVVGLDGVAPKSIASTSPTPLRGVSGRFRGWDSISSKYQSSIFFVAVVRGNEICTSGTAFVIGDNLLATAGHIADREFVRIGFEEPYLVPTKAFSAHKPGERDVGLLQFDGKPFAGLHRFPFQFRLPMLGEDVAAFGYPSLPYREFTQVIHSGSVEALPIGYKGDLFIQTSFPSGGGLSGAPLIDKRGFVVGVMVENVFPKAVDVPAKPYGQAVPFEYFARFRKLPEASRAEFSKPTV